MRCLGDDDLTSQTDERLSALLLEIDAAVLQAYDLPARLEHELLSYFPAEGRPVAHDWQHWNHPEAITGLTLAERLSLRYRTRRICRRYLRTVAARRSCGAANLLDVADYGRLYPGHQCPIAHLDPEHQRHVPIREGVRQLEHHATLFLSAMSFAELRYGVKLAETFGHASPTSATRGQNAHNSLILVHGSQRSALQGRVPKGG